jgi:hypothetical protein
VPLNDRGRELQAARAAAASTPAGGVAAARGIADPVHRLLFNRRRMLTLFWDHDRGSTPVQWGIVEQYELKQALDSLVSDTLAESSSGWARLTPAGLLVVRSLFSAG